MSWVLAILSGWLAAAAVWLMLSRNLVKYLLGLVLISNVANLVIFAAGGVMFGVPPLIPSDAEAPQGAVANALPQALILTAIVISFGLITFALTLTFRAYQTLGTVDIDDMRVAEHDDGPHPSQVVEDPEPPALEKRPADDAEAEPVRQSA